MDYRIIIETDRAGRKSYYVKKRVLWYFWAYLREIKDISFYNYIVRFETLGEAERYIQGRVNADYEKYQRKIVKREVLSR